MVRIIVSGGIGSGKSTVTLMMQELGAAVVHADEIGHLVLEPEGEAFADVADAWPEVVVDGTIDRKRLAAIVFSDNSSLVALESMTHPAIGRKLTEVTSLIHTNLLVVEIPILRSFLDSGWTKVVVATEPVVRRTRLLERGMHEADIEARIAAQPADSEWDAWADVVVSNNGSFKALRGEVHSLLGTLGRTTGSPSDTA